HRRLEHGAPPPLAHDADDQRCVDHVLRSLRRTTKPSAITERMGARATSATSPSPCASGSCPPVAAEAPSARASRNELASGPVATPPASSAIARNDGSLRRAIKTAAA